MVAIYLHNKGTAQYIYFIVRLGTVGREGGREGGEEVEGSG
jgi:hypothetical protein